MMEYIFLSLFVIACVVHLIDSWKDNTRRKISKPFLIFLLLAYYVTATDKISMILVGALLTSWIGDILLIPRGNRWLTRGGISFVCSHILFVVTFMPLICFERVPWLIVVLVMVIYCVVVCCVMKMFRKNILKKMIVPIYIYLLINATMNIFAFMNLITNLNVSSFVIYTGAILFFVSDCTLFLVRYHRNKKLIFKRHFTVMLTYILAEFLIVLGCK